MIPFLPLRLRDEGMVLHMSTGLHPGISGATGGLAERSRTGGRGLVGATGALGVAGLARTGGWASPSRSGTLGTHGRQGGY